jgi:hypothetical protein
MFSVLNNFPCYTNPTFLVISWAPIHSALYKCQHFYYKVNLRTFKNWVITIPSPPASNLRAVAMKL